MSVEVTETATTTPPTWAKAPKSRLRELAAESYQEAGEDPEQAEYLLLERLRDDPPLMVSILDEIVHGAIRRHMSQTRYRMLERNSAPSKEPRSAKLAEIAAAEETIERWYRMPMPGGKKLGDATMSDLDDAAKFHRVQAKGNNHRARIYERISKRMPDEKSAVSSVLSEEEIDKIASKS